LRIKITQLELKIQELTLSSEIIACTDIKSSTVDKKEEENFESNRDYKDETDIETKKEIETQIRNENEKLVRIIKCLLSYSYSKIRIYKNRIQT
jgi:hypothetical protein